MARQGTLPFPRREAAPGCLGAHAGLSNGAVLPSTINGYLAHSHLPKLDENSPSVKEALESARGRIPTPHVDQWNPLRGFVPQEAGQIIMGNLMGAGGRPEGIGMILARAGWKNVRVPAS